MENKEMTLIPESGHAADEQSVSKVSEKKLVPQEVCDTKNFSVGQTAELREFGENVAQREETKRVLRMEGGRHKMIFGLNADEYRDAKGNWREADNTLELQAESKDADFAGYENKSNSFKVRIAENANSKTLLSLRYGESSVRFGLKDRCRTKAGKLASRKGRLANYENKCKTLLHGNETRRCGEVDFKDVFAGADLKYQVEGDRIKESIVIKEKQASYKYEFCIETEKAELREEESGAIGIYNGATKIFSIPEAFMEDAGGDASSAVRYELRSEGEGHYHIAIIADAEWLNEEGRAFPVVLDPSLIKENQYLTCRCVGRNGTAYTSSGSPLRVGKVGDWVYRTYVNFDFGSIDGYDISNAMLLLTLSKSGSGNYYVAKSTQSSSSTTSFTSQTAACDIFTFSESEDGQYIATADITRILRDWQNGSVNSGIAIYGNEVAGQSITIQDVQLSVTCQSKRAKASKSFQKNDVRRAGSSAVDLFTGRLLFEHKDFELSSEVLPINISHEYNSDYYDEEVDNNMKIGKGWRLNLQQSYRQETYSEYQVPASGNTANVYVYTDGNGIEREITYKKYYLETRKTFYPGDYDGRTTKRYDDSGNYGEFSSDEGLRLDTNNHKIVDKSGVETYFTWDSNLNRYKLWRVSASGKALIPSYSYNQISRVSDAAGRSAVLQYNSQNYLTKITCAGKTISFEYSNGYLTKITYPDNTYTKFEYSGGRLAKVIDRSGFELDYTYTNGKVTCVQEQIANQTIGSSVVAKSSLMSGDSWDIKYLHALQTQVKNRNGLCMEYVFDVDGNTVTMYEDDRTSATDNKIAICGKAIHKNTYITELKETLDSEDLYKTKVESVEATLYKAPNKLTAIENWSANWTRSGTEGPSTACYVEGGKSYKVNGSLTLQKSLKTSMSYNSSDEGIFVFGCWAKVENSLASIDKVYTGSSGRYFGLKVTIKYGTGGGEHVYFASFDPYNTDWQLAAIAVKLDFDNVSHVDVEALYNNNLGTVYFDHAFAAKTDGGVTYMYDNNYSETWYQNYYVTTLFDDAMNDVRNIFSRFMGLSYVTENSFDANNRPLVTQNYRGVQTVRTYNNFGALLSVQTNAGSLKMYESRSYNTDSNPGNYLVESVNSDGSQTKFAYDYTDGELTSSTMPNGQKVNYTYDSMGQLKTISAVVNGLTNKNEISYNFGYITKLKHGNTTYDFTYDGYGRIKTVKAGGVTILTNTYTDFGKNLGGVSGAVSSVTSRDAMDNTVTTYTDKYGKVIATRQNNDLNENEYDAADNLIKHVDSDNNIEYNYEYNEQGDVTKYYEGDSESSAHVRVYNTYDYYNRPLKIIIHTTTTIVL